MIEEMSALEKNETWEIVDLPPGKKTVGSKCKGRRQAPSASTTDGEFGLSVHRSGGSICFRVVRRLDALRAMKKDFRGNGYQERGKCQCPSMVGRTGKCRRRREQAVVGNFPKWAKA
ncbi:hypothetical protein HAX54_047241 [Datura stramonium]|uniref:Uncharacterized protein n=1 Tax=Datura stramonium TaxID=4076 RepID=A0ABS8WI16_DATST|nr:hypothetical protein [Datura stramonium]